LKWQSFQEKVSDSIDTDMLTCSDYAILVENVPSNATDKQEWMDFFNSLPPVKEHGGKVASIAIALNNGILLNMSEKRTAQEDDLAVLRADLCRNKTEDLQKKFKEAENKLGKMRRKMAKIRARQDFKAVALFVTFESEFTRTEMQDEFAGFLTRKGTLFRNRYRLKVRRAPDPDVILWENLQNRGVESLLRDTAVFFSSTLILLVSGALIVLIMSSKKSLSIEGFPSYCIDAVDANAPNAQESIRWLRYSDGPSVFQAYLKCYCDTCKNGCGSKAALEPSFCTEWVENERNLQLLTLVGALAPAVINQVLKSGLKVIVSVEKRHTTNARDGSLAANIFYAQFMNTAWISLLVNTDVSYLVPPLKVLGKDGIGILTGEFRDMTSLW
jgi:hypothetical protein